MSDLHILIGGEAGQGLATIGESLTKALVRSGYEVLATQDYQSRIRGGHNTFSIRFGPQPVLAPRETVDVLVALDAATVHLHRHQLLGQGVVVLMGDELHDTTGDLPRVYRVPLGELVPKPMYTNTAALGVLASLVCTDLTLLEELLAEAFAAKGMEVINANIAVLRAAAAWQKAQDMALACPVMPGGATMGRLTLHSNAAVALGAMAAGCTFCAFYPMTPATSVVQTVIDHSPATRVVVEQAEDEIAAINMALGASYAGGRAMVATSGGGFALMTEGVSLAAMTETPLVIVLGMRPGPATGLPTRTEQSDLWLALHAGHGEFPRVILAPSGPEDAFHLTRRAFDLAELYQIPAIVLTDQYLADSYHAVVPFDLEALPPVAAPDLNPVEPESYQRYAVTASGVSPRAIPGLSPALVVADSDEHTADGHITEDLAMRVVMVDKRNRKHEGLAAVALPPTWHGDDHPEFLLVCWGSTLGAARESLLWLRDRGRSAAVLHYTQLWPLHADQFLRQAARAQTVVGVEGNSTGHLAGLIRRQTGFHIQHLVGRYDGLPFTAPYIIHGMQRIGLL